MIVGERGFLPKFDETPSFIRLDLYLNKCRAVMHPYPKGVWRTISHEGKQNWLTVAYSSNNKVFSLLLLFVFSKEIDW